MLCFHILQVVVVVFFVEKSRNLFSCNLRMEKALQTVSESSQSEVPTTPTKSLHSVSDPAASPISKMLAGIPKALLEKVCKIQHVWCIVLGFVIGLSFICCLV
jgi:hypothetical protein